MESPARAKKDETGIALFMVMGAVAILAVLITEFTYIASVNQKMAYDSLDGVKVHYLAKSALKLSLLRLKAYQHVKGYLASAGGAAGGVAPKGMIEKIWSFPFFYPLPTNVPGISAADKDAIEKFQAESNLEGNFTALISSESAKYNLNQHIQSFAATTQPSPSPSNAPSARPSAAPSSSPSASPSAQPSFNPEEARKAMSAYFNQIVANKIQEDDAFAAEHRDLKLDDLMDQMFAWSDRTYERITPSDRDPVKFKRAPFNTVTELHMIPLMNDELYDLFTPTLTVSSTPGININTMDEQTLKVLVPGIDKEKEVPDFFKFRDSEEEDNLFKSEEDFFKYLLNNVAVFRHDQREVDRYKDDLHKKTRLVTDETQFKITVTAQVNQSTELLEAWVTQTTNAQSTKPSTPKTPGVAPPPEPPPPTDPNQPQAKPDAGLKITFMRIL